MAKEKSADSNNKAKTQVGESLRKKVATGYIGKLRVSKAVQLRGGYLSFPNFISIAWSKIVNSCYSVSTFSN